MKKTILLSTTLGIIAVVLLLTGCAPTPYWQDPAVIAEQQATNRTEIREQGATERTDIRETERTAQIEASAERALQTRLLEQDRMDHDETMFRLYALTILGSGYSSIPWIIVGGVVGGIAGYIVRDRMHKKPAKKRKKKTLRKFARALWREIVEGLATPDYQL
jgi:outer membrane lipoprotein SlyB